MAAARVSARRRLPGVLIRPGAVKEAREAAGLSLAQIAGSDVTRAAIHLIEAGRAKPSLPVLEAIATRTGLPLRAFAADEDILAARGTSPETVAMDLSRLERSYEMDDYAGTLAKATELLDQLTGLRFEFRARYWRARAATMTGDTTTALSEIDQCIGFYRDEGDLLQLAKCLDCKGCALYVTQDAGAAEVFLAAIRELDRVQPDPFDVRMRILSHLGSLYVETHDFERAITTLDRAVSVAEGLVDLGRIGGLYDNLGLAYSEVGQTARALEYAHKAVALHRTRNDLLALANAENNLGYLLLTKGESRAAEPRIRASLKIYSDLGVERRRAHPLLSLAELHLRDGDMEGAARSALAARELADRLGEQLNSAVASEILARVAEASGSTAEADRLFLAAISILSSGNARDRLVEVHTAYATVLELRGADKAAMGQFKAALAASRGIDSSRGSSQESSA